MGISELKTTGAVLTADQVDTNAGVTYSITTKMSVVKMNNTGHGMLLRTAMDQKDVIVQSGLMYLAHSMSILLFYGGKPF